MEKIIRLRNFTTVITSFFSQAAAGLGLKNRFDSEMDLVEIIQDKETHLFNDRSHFFSSKSSKI